MEKIIDHDGNMWLKLLSTKPKPGVTRRMVYWYIVFLVFVPLIVINIWGFTSIRFYLAVIDIIANIFSSVNGGQWLGPLYSVLPTDLTSYISTNFISLLALIGATWTAIIYSMQTKSVKAGLIVASILFTITYLLPIQGVGYILTKSSIVFDKKRNFRLDDISIGFIFLLFLLIIENFFVFIYLSFLQRLS